MGELEKKVTAVLEKEFPPPDYLGFFSAGWKNDGPDGQTLVVSVASDRFEGMDDSDRQRMVWEPLRRELAQSEWLKIVMVLTFTKPEEALATAYQAD